MKISNYTKFIILCMLLCCKPLLAQIGLPGDGDVEDVPEAPIDGFITLAVIVASYLGYRKIKS